LCFKLSDPSTGQWSHPWVAVTSPEGLDQTALCVNITDKSTFDDASCVLAPKEHSVITKESAVAYRWAKVLPLAKLTASSAASMVKLFPPVSAAVLKRIQEGGLKSDFITPRNRALIERELA
jgi:hypothetical protein